MHLNRRKLFPEKKTPLQAVFGKKQKKGANPGVDRRPCRGTKRQGSGRQGKRFSLFRGKISVVFPGNGPGFSGLFPK
jgi:hypothetical protein